MTQKKTTCHSTYTLTTAWSKPTCTNGWSRRETRVASGPIPAGHSEAYGIRPCGPATPAAPLRRQEARQPSHGLYPASLFLLHHNGMRTAHRKIKPRSLLVDHHPHQSLQRPVGMDGRQAPNPTVNLSIHLTLEGVATRRNRTSLHGADHTKGTLLAHPKPP